MASSQPHLLNTAAREAFEPTCIDQCVCCVFTSADHVNLILTRGSYIDVYTVDECALQTRLRGSSRYQPADPAVKDALDILNSTGTSRPSNRSYRQFEKEHTDVLASYLTSLLTSPENQTDNPILIKTASFNSLGKVESLAVYRQHDKPTDSVIVGLSEARLAVLHYDPEKFQVRTVFAHSAEELRHELSVEYSRVTRPLLAVDPEERCIAMTAFDTHVYVFPSATYQDILGDDDDGFLTGSSLLRRPGPLSSLPSLQPTPLVPSITATSTTSTQAVTQPPFLPPYVFSVPALSNIGRSGMPRHSHRVKDIAMLSGTSDPCLLLLIEHTYTWAGRSAVMRNSCSLFMVSLTMEAVSNGFSSATSSTTALAGQWRHRLVGVVSDLPFDSFTIAPLPSIPSLTGAPTVNTVLILSPSSVHHINTASGTVDYVYALNAFADNIERFTFSHIDKRDIIKQPSSSQLSDQGHKQEEGGDTDAPMFEYTDADFDRRDMNEGHTAGRKLIKMPPTNGGGMSLAHCYAVPLRTRVSVAVSPRTPLSSSSFSSSSSSTRPQSRWSTPSTSSSSSVFTTKHIDIPTTYSMRSSSLIRALLPQTASPSLSAKRVTFEMLIVLQDHSVCVLSTSVEGTSAVYINLRFVCETNDQPSCLALLKPRSRIYSSRYQHISSSTSPTSPAMVSAIKSDPFHPFSTSSPSRGMSALAFMGSRLGNSTLFIAQRSTKSSSPSSSTPLSSPSSSTSSLSLPSLSHSSSSASMGPDDSDSELDESEITSPSQSRPAPVIKPSTRMSTTAPSLGRTVKKEEVAVTTSAATSVAPVSDDFDDLFGTSGDGTMSAGATGPTSSGSTKGDDKKQTIGETSMEDDDLDDLFTPSDISTTRDASSSTKVGKAGDVSGVSSGGGKAKILEDTESIEAEDLKSKTALSSVLAEPSVPRRALVAVHPSQLLYSGTRYVLSVIDTISAHSPITSLTLVNRFEYPLDLFPSISPTTSRSTHDDIDDTQLTLEQLPGPQSIVGAASTRRSGALVDLSEGVRPSRLASTQDHSGIGPIRQAFSFTTAENPFSPSPPSIKFALPASFTRLIEAVSSALVAVDSSSSTASDSTASSLWTLLQTAVFEANAVIGHGSSLVPSLIASSSSSSSSSSPSSLLSSGSSPQMTTFETSSRVLTTLAQVKRDLRRSLKRRAATLSTSPTTSLTNNTSDKRISTASSLLQLLLAYSPTRPTLDASVRSALERHLSGQANQPGSPFLQMDFVSLLLSSSSSSSSTSSTTPFAGSDMAASDLYKQIITQLLSLAKSFPTQFQSPSSLVALQLSLLLSDLRLCLSLCAFQAACFHLQRAHTLSIGSTSSVSTVSNAPTSTTGSSLLSRKRKQRDDELPSDDQSKLLVTDLSSSSSPASSSHSDKPIHSTSVETGEDASFTCLALSGDTSSSFFTTSSSRTIQNLCAKVAGVSDQGLQSMLRSSPGNPLSDLDKVIASALSDDTDSGRLVPLASDITSSSDSQTVLIGSAPTLYMGRVCSSSSSLSMPSSLSSTSTPQVTHSLVSSGLCLQVTPTVIRLSDNCKTVLCDISIASSVAPLASTDHATLGSTVTVSKKQDTAHDDALLGSTYLVEPHDLRAGVLLSAQEMLRNTVNVSAAAVSKTTDGTGAAKASSAMKSALGILSSLVDDASANSHSSSSSSPSQATSTTTAAPISSSTSSIHVSADSSGSTATPHSLTGATKQTSTVTKSVTIASVLGATTQLPGSAAVAATSGLTRAHALGSIYITSCCVVGDMLVLRLNTGSIKLVVFNASPCTPHWYSVIDISQALGVDPLEVTATRATQLLNNLTNAVDAYTQQLYEATKEQETPSSNEQTNGTSASISPLSPSPTSSTSLASSSSSLGSSPADSMADDDNETKAIGDVGDDAGIDLNIEQGNLGVTEIHLDEQQQSQVDAYAVDICRLLTALPQPQPHAPTAVTALATSTISICSLCPSLMNVVRNLRTSVLGSQTHSNHPSQSTCGCGGDCTVPVLLVARPGTTTIYSLPHLHTLATIVSPATGQASLANTLLANHAASISQATHIATMSPSTSSSSSVSQGTLSLSDADIFESTSSTPSTYYPFVSDPQSMAKSFLTTTPGSSALTQLLLQAPPCGAQPVSLPISSWPAIVELALVQSSSPSPTSDASFNGGSTHQLCCMTDSGLIQMYTLHETSSFSIDQVTASLASFAFALKDHTGSSQPITRLLSSLCSISFLLRLLPLPIALTHAHLSYTPWSYLYDSSSTNSTEPLRSGPACPGHATPSSLISMTVRHAFNRPLPGLGSALYSGPLIKPSAGRTTTPISKYYSTFLDFVEVSPLDLLLAYDLVTQTADTLATSSFGNTTAPTVMHVGEVFRVSAAFSHTSRFSVNGVHALLQPPTPPSAASMQDGAKPVLSRTVQLLKWVASECNVPAPGAVASGVRRLIPFDSHAGTSGLLVLASQPLLLINHRRYPRSHILLPSLDYAQCDLDTPSNPIASLANEISAVAFVRDTFSAASSFFAATSFAIVSPPAPGATRSTTSQQQQQLPTQILSLTLPISHREHLVYPSVDCASGVYGKSSRSLVDVVADAYSTTATMTKLINRVRRTLLKHRLITVLSDTLPSSYAGDDIDPDTPTVPTACLSLVRAIASLSTVINHLNVSSSSPSQSATRVKRGQSATQDNQLVNRLTSQTGHDESQLGPLLPLLDFAQIIAEESNALSFIPSITMHPSSQLLPPHILDVCRQFMILPDGPSIHILSHLRNVSEIDALWSLLIRRVTTPYFNKVSLSNRLVERHLPLGCTPQQVAYHASTNTIVAVLVNDSSAVIPSREEPNPLALPNRFEAATSVVFYRAKDMRIIHTQGRLFDGADAVTSFSSIKLNKKMYIVIGVTDHQTQAQACKGKIFILSPYYTQGMGMDGSVTTFFKVKVACHREVVPVCAISAVDNMLAVSLGTRLMLYSYSPHTTMTSYSNVRDQTYIIDDSGQETKSSGTKITSLEGKALFELDGWSIGIRTIKNYLLISDAFAGVQVVVWDKVSRNLYPLARLASQLPQDAKCVCGGRDQRNVTAADWLIRGQDLGVAVSDMSSHTTIASYNSHAPARERIFKRFPSHTTHHSLATVTASHPLLSLPTSYQDITASAQAARLMPRVPAVSTVLQQLTTLLAVPRPNPNLLPSLPNFFAGVNISNVQALHDGSIAIVSPICACAQQRLSALELVMKHTPTPTPSLATATATLALPVHAQGQTTVQTSSNGCGVNLRLVDMWRSYLDVDAQTYVALRSSETVQRIASDAVMVMASSSLNPVRW